jgi:hypothetical protein
MSDFQSIVPVDDPVKVFWEDFRTHACNSVRGVLTNQMVFDACTAAQWSYRERCLPPVLVILHMVLAAIWPEDSFAASWQVLWAGACAQHAGSPTNVSPPGSGSQAKARQRIPAAVWRYILEAVTQRAATLGAPFDDWRGLRPILVDGTCLSMSAEKELFAAFGTCSSRGKKGRFPLARVVVLALARSRTILTYAMGAYTEAETALLRQLLPALKPNDLLIADRFFASAYAYILYRAVGAHFITRVHQRLNIQALRPLRVFSNADFIVDLPMGPKHRRLFPELPTAIRVRLIRVTIRGRDGMETLWLATSLLDAHTYPAAEIAQLYAERWSVETLFREFKVNLSADVLRSKTANGIRKEVMARIVALNVLRVLMLEAAIQSGVDPRRISFVQTLRTVLSFAPAFAYQPAAFLVGLYHCMLREIARALVPLRPNRLEPRAIRREKKHYPSLKTTRNEWRHTHGCAA